MADTKRVRELLKAFGQKYGNEQLVENTDKFDDQTCMDSLRYLMKRARQFSDVEREEARTELEAVASLDRRAGR